mgnify:CR=1 FL=1
MKPSEWWSVLCIASVCLMLTGCATVMPSSTSCSLAIDESLLQPCRFEVEKLKQDNTMGGLLKALQSVSEQSRACANEKAALIGEVRVAQKCDQRQEK